MKFFPFFRSRYIFLRILFSKKENGMSQNLFSFSKIAEKHIPNSVHVIITESAWRSKFTCTCETCLRKVCLVKYLVWPKPSIANKSVLLVRHAHLYENLCKHYIMMRGKHMELYMSFLFAFFSATPYYLPRKMLCTCVKSFFSWTAKPFRNRAYPQRKEFAPREQILFFKN